MKTKNNIQKTALTTVAAVTGLALLSLTVHAQGVLKSYFENEGTGHIAMVMETSTNNIFSVNTYIGSFINAETFAAYLEAETEVPLNVEAWMIEDKNFDSFSALLETETESEMVVENWMMNENILSINEQKPKLTKKESQPISTATYFYREVNIEEKLEVESWMLNSKVCGK